MTEDEWRRNHEDGIGTGLSHLQDAFGVRNSAPTDDVLGGAEKSAPCLHLFECGFENALARESAVAIVLVNGGLAVGQKPLLVRNRVHGGDALDGRTVIEDAGDFRE